MKLNLSKSSCFSCGVRTEWLGTNLCSVISTILGDNINELINVCIYLINILKYNRVKDY